jgi:uncharacterized protein involved in outer membrane biogenesis
MKRKWIIRVAVGLLAVLAALVVVVAFSLGSIVKKGMETIGPKATQVDFKLKSAGVWLFAWRVELTGLVLGNPPGYKTPTAITVEDVSVRVKPLSAFSEKVVVESINVKGLVITLEGGLRDNNLKKIENNLNEYVGNSSTAANSTSANSTAPSTSPAKPERKLQVNDLVIRNATLQVKTKISAGRTITLSIPEIHLTNLGSGPEGITGVEVAQRMLHAMLEASVTAIAQNAGNLGEEGAKDAKNAVQKAADAVKGWFH